MTLNITNKMNRIFEEVEELAAELESKRGEYNIFTVRTIELLSDVDTLKTDFLDTMLNGRITKHDKKYKGEDY